MEHQKDKITVGEIIKKKTQQKAARGELHGMTDSEIFELCLMELMKGIKK